MIVFANIKSPYHAMYLMDKDLMKEHLLGPSRSVDFGHTVFNPRYQNFELLLFDMMAKANLGLIYKDIPDGFFHRSVVPVNKNTKRVEKYCLIKHLSNKYANEKNNKYLGNIKIEDIYY